MRSFFLQPIYDLVGGLESQILGAARRRRAVCLLLIAVVATWWLYVPIHELLHALGCRITGGEVAELQVAPMYGGAVLARLFPFVVSGGDYAGRLSGFDVKGSDVIYLATDALPYLLTILIGVPLLKVSAKGKRPVLFGVSVVLGLAPLYNLTGDYYEMGSILTTRTVTVARGGGEPVAFVALRSDDVFKLVDDIWSRPQELQLHGRADTMTAFALVGVSLVAGALLALATYALGGWVAGILLRRIDARRCNPPC